MPRVGSMSPVISRLFGTSDTGRSHRRHPQIFADPGEDLGRLPHEVLVVVEPVASGELSEEPAPTHERLEVELLLRAVVAPAQPHVQGVPDREDLLKLEPPREHVREAQLECRLMRQGLRPEVQVQPVADDQRLTTLARPPVDEFDNVYILKCP